jgi:membrane associated rhomboid family serine protease
MFPFKDENPTELAPIVTVGLLIANVAVWVLVQGMGANLQPSVCEFGLIPAEVTGQAAQGPDICRFGGLTWGAAFTSMFMHGGWLHLVSNMMFLWVFGNNIEDSMGHARFAVFYVLCGLVAAFAHVFLHPSSSLPTVGASGAISGVLGAYIVLYPQARVYVYFPPFWILPMRAWVALGYWIMIQLFMGLADLGGAAGGVAVWAHIGGFFAGVILVKLFERPQLVEAKREGRRLDREEIRAHHYWW